MAESTFARLPAFAAPLASRSVALVLAVLAALLATALPPSAARAQQATVGTVSGNPPNNAVYFPGGGPPLYFYNPANAARLAVVFNAMQAGADKCSDAAWWAAYSQYDDVVYCTR